jgi:hypothetical protein
MWNMFSLCSNMDAALRSNGAERAVAASLIWVDRL